MRNAPFPAAALEVVDVPADGLDASGGAALGNYIRTRAEPLHRQAVGLNDCRLFVAERDGHIGDHVHRVLYVGPALDVVGDELLDGPLEDAMVVVGVVVVHRSEKIPITAIDGTAVRQQHIVNLRASLQLVDEASERRHPCVLTQSRSVSSPPSSKVDTSLMLALETQNRGWRCTGKKGTSAIICFCASFSA